MRRGSVRLVRRGRREGKGKNKIGGGQEDGEEMRGE